MVLALEMHETEAYFVFFIYRCIQHTHEKLVFFQRTTSSYLGLSPLPVIVANEGIYRDPRA